MLGPTVTPKMSGFYPVGNTPPVDVLESIPPGQDAAVLLLGCGDARNLLFTLYSRPSSDQSHLKFTCCDISAEIIARNILLYTLLIDDLDGTDTSRIWNIYYHSMLDQDSLRMLQKQARKLADLGKTIENWRQQPYGKVLHFCDQSTFDCVVKLWRWYALDITNGPAFKKQQERLRYTSKLALDMHQKIMGGSCNVSTLRSAAPCSKPVMEHMAMLLHGYWTTGLADNDAKLIAISKCYNPTFSTMHGLLWVYSSMEPLQSFHLATAYVPLKRDSPFNPNSGTLPGRYPPAQAAARQFQTWTETFRQVKDCLTIRFTASEARAFCYVLQHHVVHHNSEGAFQYRDSSRYEQLVLDPVEYRSEPPVKEMFDVIDTSNLVDHWGSLNMLAACRPLLKPGITSTIYMELLQLRDESLEAYAKGLLCGDFVTVSLLFGLNPIQCWTNSTAFSPYPEALGRAITEGEGGQARFIIAWKNANVAGLKFDPDYLARFVYKMYLRMFEHEGPTTQSSKAANRLARIQFPQYTSAGLALILSLIKNANFVDFTIFLERLRSCLYSGSTQEEARSQYVQSFDLHLHEFQLCTSTTHSEKMENAKSLGFNPFRDWLDISSAVVITVAVPHSKWSPFLACSKPNLWPLFQLSLRLPNADREFRSDDVQIGFGVIRTTGTRHTFNYTVDIETDEREVEGSSPLNFSALVPARMLLGNLRSSTVGVRFMPRSHGDAGASALMEMMASSIPSWADTLHTATMDHKSVFITPNPPNMKGRMTCPSVPGECMWQQTAAGAPGTGKVLFHMIFDEKATRAEKVNIHIDLSSTYAEGLLLLKAQVEFKRLSTFVLELTIGSGSMAFSQQIRLPIALTISGSRTRIDRRSAYVEFIATVAAPDVLSIQPDSLHPISLVCGKPILENVGYIQLENLPTVDVSDASKLEWMTPHLKSMLSIREKDISNRFIDPEIQSKDPRFNFKWNLGVVFALYAGLVEETQQNTFILMRRGEAVPNTVVFISALRLDLASLSITLDAAMLHSTAMHGQPERQELLMQMQGKGSVIELDDDDLALWKHATAAFVERCRDWEHTATCEHASPNVSMVPTAGVDGNILCSCGLGKFPQGYKPDVPEWTSVAKYCVRMAISPCYSVPLVEKVIDESESLEEAEKRIANLDPMKQGCWGCNRHVSEGQKLLKCGECKVAQYCSKACQVKDWKHGQHKLVCKAMKLGV